MNNWNGSGFVTRDPDIRTISTKNGEMKMASFSLACQRKGKDAVADFINCKAFGKTAEVVEKYIHKGSGVEVKGRIQTGSYDGQNGKVYTTDVVCDDIEFPKVRKNEEQSQGGDTYTNDAQQNTQSPPPQEENSFMNIPANIADSLPFR